MSQPVTKSPFPSDNTKEVHQSIACLGVIGIKDELLESIRVEKASISKSVSINHLYMHWGNRNRDGRVSWFFIITDSWKEAFYYAVTKLVVKSDLGVE